MEWAAGGWLSDSTAPGTTAVAYVAFVGAGPRAAQSACRRSAADFVGAAQSAPVGAAPRTL